MLNEINDLAGQHEVSTETLRADCVFLIIFYVAGDSGEPEHGRGVRPDHPRQEHEGWQEEGKKQAFNFSSDTDTGGLGSGYIFSPLISFPFV